VRAPSCRALVCCGRTCCSCSACMAREICACCSSNCCGVGFVQSRGSTNDRGPSAAGNRGACIAVTEGTQIKGQVVGQTTDARAESISSAVGKDNQNKTVRPEPNVTGSVSRHESWHMHVITCKRLGMLLSSLAKEYVPRRRVCSAASSAIVGCVVLYSALLCSAPCLGQQQQRGTVRALVQRRRRRHQNGAKQQRTWDRGRSPTRPFHSFRPSSVPLCRASVSGTRVSHAAAQTGCNRSGTAEEQRGQERAKHKRNGTVQHPFPSSSCLHMRLPGLPLFFFAPVSYAKAISQRLFPHSARCLPLCPCHCRCCCCCRGLRGGLRRGVEPAFDGEGEEDDDVAF
jgi:hypothetical protein